MIVSFKDMVFCGWKEVDIIESSKVILRIKKDQGVESPH